MCYVDKSGIMWGMEKGRPTIFNQELATKICDRIALGESTRTILKSEDMPASSAFYRWLTEEDKKDFKEQYEKACNARAELMFEELLEIADDGTNDWMKKNNKDGSTFTVIDSEHIQRSRLRVDTRKWYLSKVLPKKYGDKLDLSTLGKELPTPILGGITNEIQRNNSTTENTGS